MLSELCHDSFPALVVDLLLDALNDYSLNQGKQISVLAPLNTELSIRSFGASAHLDQQTFKTMAHSYILFVPTWNDIQSLPRDSEFAQRDRSLTA